jgi:citrate lyase subunit beta/citryl-CoA lyase
MTLARARRSSLILPVNVPKFVERAHLRGADAVVLDLEDAVPMAEKEHARRLVAGALHLVGRGGAEVLVRVNNDAAMLAEDPDAAVHPGLDGVSFPKAESADQIGALAARIETLERTRGMPPGHVRLSVAIESPRGLLAAREIAVASERIVTMGTELLYAVSTVVTIAKAVGIQSTGLLGSIAGFRDIAAFEAAAVRARQFGCERAGCIHPDQVVVLNRVFSPDPAKVEYAERVVAAFEDGVRRGTASVDLDGKMVDIPVYKRALVILARARAVAETERRKTDALARLG